MPQTEIVASSVDQTLPTSSQAPALYLVVIVGCVLAVLAAIVGGIYLAAVDRLLPGEIIALAGVCAGGIVSVLAPAPARQQ